MITGSLVVVCAIFGIVSGSYIEFNTPQEYYAPQVSVPIQTGPSYSAPVVPDNVFSTGYPGYSPSSAVSNNVFSSGSSSFSPVYTPLVSPPVSENVYSTGASASVPVVFAQQSAPVVQASGNSLSEILSSGSNTPVSEIVPSVSSGSSFSEFPSSETPVVSTSSQQAPRVVSQRYICTKTIVRPEVYQRTIIVPTFQRYLRRIVTPVIENTAYKTTPVTQESSSSGPGSYLSNYLSGTGSGSSSSVVSSGSSGQRQS